MRKAILYPIVFLLFLFTGSSVSARELDYTNTKEKVYLQTNHVFFKPGEELYFKLYLVNAQDQKPSSVSPVAYAEILNPSGNLLVKMKLKAADGYATGSYKFDATAVGGIYTIRAYTKWMQNEKDSLFFQKKITVQKLIAPRVLMKLEFPEKGYGAGDKVSADFSMRSVQDKPIANHTGSYAVSVSGANILNGSFTTNNEGKAKISFTLPANLASTDGLLNITVSYDAYTESISRSIPIVLNNIDLQFMPEGGTLVNGLESNIAFRAVNEFGKPADVKAIITDERGNKVKELESYHFGMGVFSFLPQEGHQYSVKIVKPTGIKQQYALPYAASSGLVMSMTQGKDQLTVTLNSTQDGTVKLVGQTKNKDYFAKDISIKKGTQEIAINKSDFPAGITRFTVYNHAGLPVAERLMFLNQEKTLHLTVKTDKESYLPREQVKLNVKTVDENGKPVPSNLSLTVIDDKLWTLADDKQDNILSWLLMSSELKGEIEEPTFYFKKEEEKASRSLDLVMLTHGYRYFDYTENVASKNMTAFLPDEENVLGGYLTDLTGKRIKGKVYLVAPSTGNVSEIITSDSGAFYFTRLLPSNKYTLVAQSIYEKGNINIHVTENGVGNNPFAAYKLPSATERYIIKEDNTRVLQQARDIPEAIDVAGNGNRQPLKRELLENMATRNTADFAALGTSVVQQQGGALNIGGGRAQGTLYVMDGVMVGGDMNNTNLEEVVTVGYGVTKRANVLGSVSQLTASAALPYNVSQALVGRLAGVSISPNGNPGAAGNIIIRGQGSLSRGIEPLLVVDGVSTERFDNSINTYDIESISVLKDAAAIASYGSRAANGVVLVTTKNRAGYKILADITPNANVTTQTITTQGNNDYTVSRNMYAPKYTTTQTSVRNDFRETIYWNPVVQTDEKGEATVTFYNSDANTTFRAITEGIGYNGICGRTETTYSTQNMLTIDAKIPPYLTVGDKAMIPVVLKNNSKKPVTASLSVNMPAQFAANHFQKEVTIAPSSSQQVLVPAAATEVASDSIQFMLTSGSITENLKLPVQVSEKGFPVVITKSGTASGNHSFTLNNVVPNSIKTDLKIFKNPEGQLVDGIASMLREPGGCFEQTSSSNYPNVFVLKYLRETGKSNPEIERKALGYLQNGYNRLISFETSENGFEWFGKAPAHEALTAYGLMEFTDMKPFVKVDEQMLVRTKKFLLSKRDGKGSFTIRNTGYDQFASVPAKIANAYIVYAMTEAGVGSEIEKEYNHAVNQAIDANDGYQLAMMALAAKNMKKENDFSKLLGLLAKKYHEGDLPSETSVVNSRSVSLRIEALSLYALALMKTNEPDIAAISQLLSYITAQKSYFGYGSTQATVMALKAVTAFAAVTNRMLSGTVSFALNGQTLTEGKQLSANVNQGDNSFIVKYDDDNKAVPYSLEVSYSTSLPPNDSKAEIKINTRLATENAKVGETVRMNITAVNTENKLQPMTIAKVGIPAGLTAQPWQLKEILEQKKAAYYEIFDNYLVFYWYGFAARETKTIALDLKAEIPGNYTGKASNTYLYYTPEYKNWNQGLTVNILP